MGHPWGPARVVAAGDGAWGALLHTQTHVHAQPPANGMIVMTRGDRGAITKAMEGHGRARKGRLQVRVRTSSSSDESATGAGLSRRLSDVSVTVSRRAGPPRVAREA